MLDLVVVGGGFAGMWAALSAAHETICNTVDIRITVVSPDPFLTVRPRLYERDPETLRVPLAPAFDSLGIHFKEGAVTAVDARDQSITVRHVDGNLVKIRYDQLIIATGSELKKPPISGLDLYGFNVDTYREAVALDGHLASVLKTPHGPGHNTFVVLGAGFTGIELATEMRDRITVHSDCRTADDARVILIEQADVAGPELGARPRPVIEEALRHAHVELRLGTWIERVEQDAVTLSTGERVPTKTVIVTTGQRANPLSELLLVELDELGRAPTDEMLRVKGLSHIYAAGDIARVYADGAHLALMSCQHAIAMGQFAGYNAARELIGLPLRAYFQPDYVTCIDLGRFGALFTTGWDREISITGMEAKQLKRQINTQLIYPPQGDRRSLLSAIQVYSRVASEGRN